MYTLQKIRWYLHKPRQTTDSSIITMSCLKMISILIVWILISVVSYWHTMCLLFSFLHFRENFQAYFCLAAHHQASETNINEKRTIPRPHHIPRSHRKVISSLQKIWSIIIKRHHHNVSLQNNPSSIVQALVSVINSWHTICLLFKFLTFAAFSQVCFPLTAHHQASKMYMNVQQTLPS